MNSNLPRTKYVYLSGSFVSYDDILAPLSLFGYGAYTTIKYTPEGLLFLNKHLERLQYNCKELNIVYPSDEEIINAIRSTVNQNDCSNKEAIVRVTLFPETISWENPHQIKGTPCTILVTIREMYYLPENFKLKTVQLSRPLPHLKTINYTVNFLAKSKARESGFHDGLFINEKGFITEGTAWNIFFIKNNTVYTPSFESGLLKGITREAIISICNTLKIELKSEFIPVNSIEAFNTAFITNATQGPHAVLQIDNHEYSIQDDLLKLIKAEYNNFTLAKL